MPFLLRLINVLESLLSVSKFILKSPSKVLYILLTPSNFELLVLNVFSKTTNFYVLFYQCSESAEDKNYVFLTF